VEEIERAINNLRAIQTENLTVKDIPRIKEAIETCKNASMKIGRAMY
jgi:hypothetical protein